MAVELAMAGAKAPADTRRWPELARFDCFACHHELVEPGRGVGYDVANWCQLRQAAGAVGRPQLAVGCVPIVKIAAEVVNDSAAESVDAVLSRLRQPFTANVFGEPKLLAEQGAAVIAWCKTLEARLARVDIQGTSGTHLARTVLRKLAQHANARCDYDTARQLYGAWSVVYTELLANSAIRLSAANQAELDKQLARINRQDPFVLERDRIKPPCEAPPETNWTTTQRGEQLEKAVQRAFSTRAKYDPDIFADIMASLARLTDE
jgi:hypothetical protein